MPENPISDVIEFLANPSWPTPIFWLLMIASISIAVIVWRRRPEQRDFSHLAQWGFRFVMGGFWWQQTLWKLPPTFAQDPSSRLTTGLAYWMSQISKFSAIPLQGEVFANIVLPHFYLFAPIVYAAEVLVAVWACLHASLGCSALCKSSIYSLAFTMCLASGRGLTSSCSCCN
jgi:hypothetical protein